MNIVAVADSEVPFEKITKVRCGDIKMTGDVFDLAFFRIVDVFMNIGEHLLFIHPTGIRKPGIARQ